MYKINIIIDNNKKNKQFNYIKNINIQNHENHTCILSIEHIR